jgi:nucleoside-diphosphate-sugar epimerase
MKALVIGGSGHVGSLIVPRLAAHYGHELTLLDIRPPAYEPPGAHVLAGDLLDATALGVAAARVKHEAVLFLAMGAHVPGDRWATAQSAFDVNARGVWLACQAAVEAGIRRFVLASSLSVYEDCFARPLPNADEPPDATSLYGLTKSFGEAALRAWTQRSDPARRLEGIALRLCLPVADEAEVERIYKIGRGDCALTADETARAFHAALTVPHQGFAAVPVVGRHAHDRVNLARTKALLGWEPDRA